MIQLILIELFKIVKRPRTYIGFLAIFLTVGAMQLAMFYEGEELISIAIQNLENDFRLEGKIINTNQNGKTPRFNHIKIISILKYV